MLYLLTILLSALSLLAPSAAFAEHFLQTKLIKQPNGHKDFGSHKGNLFVEAYHTGAGLNDAVLIPSPNTASKFFLNGTTGQFDLNSPSISWFLAMGGDANYAGWELVQINAFDGTTGFFTNSTGLQWNQTYDGFGGWMACDWWHGAPQLFWLDFYQPFPIPASCSKVDLALVTV